MNEAVTLSIDARGVAVIALNRPELHNALDDHAVALLCRHLTRLAEDRSVRVVVLTGNGISFSTGHDIDWMRRMATSTPEALQTDTRQVAQMLALLDTLPQPTIARVHGSAFGMGAGLVACCDVAIGVSDALFGFSDVKLGVIPAMVAPYIIRAIGERATRRYFITAERFNAGKAKRLGLLHQVVENDEIDYAVDHMVSHLLINGPHAMTAAKHLVATIGSAGLSPGVTDLTVDTIVRLRGSDEGREGILAFLEKRKPGWVD